MDSSGKVWAERPFISRGASDFSPSNDFPSCCSKQARLHGGARNDVGATKPSPKQRLAGMQRRHERLRLHGNGCSPAHEDGERSHHRTNSANQTDFSALVTRPARFRCGHQATVRSCRGPMPIVHSHIDDSEQREEVRSDTALRRTSVRQSNLGAFTIQGLCLP